jgi:hypothetical protein
MATKIKITTDFDCTTTGVTGHYKATRVPFKDKSGQLISSQEDWEKARNQQRNWETLTQLISLYTQPYDLTAPRYNNKTKQWYFEFRVEFDGIFESPNDSLGLLKQAAAGVPILTDLSTTNAQISFLEPGKNVFFEDITEPTTNK